MRTYTCTLLAERNIARLYCRHAYEVELIYKKILEILLGNFRLVRTVHLIYHLLNISGLSRHARLDSSYNMKLVQNSRNLCMVNEFPFGMSQPGKRD